MPWGPSSANGTLSTAGTCITWPGRSKICSSADGLIELTNNAGTGFTRLNLGGTTTSFPAITRSGAAIHFTLGDGTSYAAHNSANHTITGTADRVQQSILGYATQTSELLKVMTSDSVDVFSVRNATSVNSVVFTGAGLNDGTSGGTYTGTAPATYDVEIDATGTPDTFKWRKNAGSYTAGVAITGAAQTLSDGVTITFAATTGHTLADVWTLDAYPVSTYSARPIAINGTADRAQLTVQGHSTQTNKIFLVEKSDGTDLFSIANDGDVIIHDQSGSGYHITLKTSGVTQYLEVRNEADSAYRPFKANEMHLSDGTDVAAFFCDTASTMGLYNAAGGSAHFNVGSSAKIGWSSSAIPSGTLDSAFVRVAAGIVGLTDGSTGGSTLELTEQTAPTGSANKARIYAEDDGGGKTRLMVIFGSGAAQQIAIEP